MTRYISPTSWPSAVTTGKPKPSARRLIESPAMEFRICVSTAYWLFSHTDDQRQLPERREVDELPYPPGIGAAVTEEAHRDARSAFDLEAQRDPERDTQAPAHDAVRPVEVAIEVGKVHVAAATAQATRLLAVELSHHLARGEPLAQGVVVAAVAAGHDIVAPERADDADGDRLLARRRVHAAGILPSSDRRLETRSNSRMSSIACSHSGSSCRRQALQGDVQEPRVGRLVPLDRHVSTS